MIQRAALVGINSLKCRVCGHGHTESIGQIPDCAEFAGQPVSPSIKGGELWVCKDCGSMFRHPTLSASDYIALYEKAPDTVWVGSNNARNDFATIYAYLKNHVGGSILDVGCYTGDFLSGLSNNFEKFGIEPSVSAAKNATAKGLTVLGKTLDELDSNKVFYVIVAIDVIEHVLEVEDFLSEAISHVKENGLLIISTGNPGCYFWRNIFKSKFWYCYFAEHVTFPGYSYYFEFSRRCGLPPPKQMRIRYTRMNFMTRIIAMLHFIYIYARYKFSKSVHGITSGNEATVPTMGHASLIGVFKDHHMVIFKNKGL
jgi:SAM-dependent methyltransferase